MRQDRGGRSGWCRRWPSHPPSCIAEALIGVRRTASLARGPESGGGQARPAGLGAQPDLRIVRIASADAELRKTLIDECLAGCLIALHGARDWMAVNGQGNARRISLRCLPRGGPITCWRPFLGCGVVCRRGATVAPSADRNPPWEATWWRLPVLQTQGASRDGGCG